jgi:pSer/pThr/pTyr-binding forkhead associated (FHA) protein
MAKLFLKFEQAVLKEYPLSQGVLTIGRLPDNLIQVDNLAVSGHHAKIYWETDHYVVEDNNSLNGTFVNNRRVSKVVLKNGDEVLIGKHTIVFNDEWHEDQPADRPAQKTMPMVPTLESTVVLDTRKAKEMLSRQPATPPPPAPAAPGAPAAPVAEAAPPPPPPPAKERIGMLTIMAGKTDQSQYVLGGKLTVIGKSDMASIKLKGWFAPKVAAVINKRDNKYFVAASEKDVKVKVNGAVVSGQHELSDGDVIEVAGVKATFSFGD